MAAGLVSALLAWAPTSAAPDPDTYEVQPSDSLSEIASRTGIEVALLVRLNDLENPDFIVAGASLKLRAAAPSGAEVAVAPPALVYRVQPGDTLSDIGDRFAVSPQAIASLNRMANPDLVAVDIELTLPPEAKPPVTPTPIPTPTPTPQPSIAPTATPVPTGGASRTPTPGASSPFATSLPRPTPMMGPISSAPVPPNSGPPTVQVALRYRGAPYVSAGVTPAGFDCSGFVYFVQEQAGRPIGRDIFEQYDAGPHPMDQLRAGDLVFFQDTYMTGLSHNGIYVGNGLFIHAIDEARGVGISNLGDAYWLTHWYGATRLA